jgi:hypothetical protein
MLANYTTVTITTPEEVQTTYQDSPYIMLVGRPDLNGTVGALIHTLLQDYGDVLPNMMESDDYRLAVRYGVWNQTQTVVLLSHPYPSDLYTVLDILRTKTVTVNPNMVEVEYLTPRDIFVTGEMDTVKETDSFVAVDLLQAVTPSVGVTLYNTSTTPSNLTTASGLVGYEEAVGRYLEIGVSGNVQNQTTNNINGSMIQIFYTASDLDRTGDGYVGDPGDLNETALTLYHLDESTGQWVKLTEDLAWVMGTGVDTTNFELYGNSYEGFVWAIVTHLSTYGVAGQTYNRAPNVTDVYPSVDYLWPANQKFMDVTIMGATDPDGDTVNITITGITSDEPTASLEGAGGGKHAPDAYGVGTSTASLRAERSGTGNGRVYQITFLATDGKGGETPGTVNVYVPHNMKGGGYTCTDDGQLYDATTIN